MKKDAHIDVSVVSSGMRYMDATSRNGYYVQTKQQNGNMTPQEAIKILSTGGYGKTPEEFDVAVSVIDALIEEYEQMLKDAVEGKIYGCDGLHWIETDADENIKGKEGDKVKIIIVKED